MQGLGWFIQPPVFPWVALVLGLCVGSFLNVVIHRLPKMLEREWRADCAELMGAAPAVEGQAPPAEGRYDLFTPRSSCPGCARPIRPIENIPLLSWLALRGRCAGCSARISARYPLVELLTGLGTAWTAAHFGFGLAAGAAMLFIWGTIALAFIDQATGYLLDDITLPLMWAGLLCNAFGAFVPLFDAVLGAAAGYLFLWLVNAGYRLIRGHEGMGYGDFKMTAAVGAFLGWAALPLVILTSSLVGLVFGVVQMAGSIGKWDWQFKFHFGPAIAIAGVVVLFYGRDIQFLIPLLKLF